MYSEALNNKENLLIVPLKNEYFSKQVNVRTTNKNNSHPIQYLIVVRNSKGEIRRSDIVLFYPKDTTLDALPKNSFHDFFTYESLSVDGTLTLISLSDRKQFEMDFRNGKKAEFRLWQSRIKNHNQRTSVITIDWYMVTTYYFPDGTTYQTEEYLYTTYLDDCGGDTACLEQFSGGGGGGGVATDYGTSVSNQVELVVWRQQTDYEDWKISGFFTLTGVSFSNAANNYFTGISHDVSQCWYYNSVTAGWQQSGWYSMYTSLSHSEGLINPTTASGRAEAQMYYPNLPQTYGGPQTKYYGLGQTWQASIALY